VSPFLLLLACPAKDPEPTTVPTGDTATDGTDDTTDPTPGTVAGFALTVDEAMPLMLHATFTSSGAEAWVEYRFETDDWLVAPTIAPGEAVILGIPELTDVVARAVEEVDGELRYSEAVTATTGALPGVLPAITISNYDAARASPEPYAMISVAAGNSFWQGPYFVEIFDRSGRVVWFYRVPDNLFCLYPSPAFDGTHVWFEKENIFGFGYGQTGVVRRTLDGRWEVELPIDDIGQAIGEGPDGSFFYEFRGNTHSVNQLGPDGGTTEVWDCDAHMASIGVFDSSACLLNTTNWTESRNTVLASQFETGTVFEIDLSTGQAVRQFGQLTEGDPYTFDPPESMFAYQHFPNWTPAGTLLVSTHVPCGSQAGCDEISGRSGIQLSSEYAVDDAAKTITRLNFIRSDDLWATQAGESYELPNGNRIQGYGQDGAAREYTADGDVVWQVEWDKANDGTRAVGHLSLIGDLYALNVGH
jgi:hypothetical protein